MRALLILLACSGDLPDEGPALEEQAPEMEGGHQLIPPNDPHREGHPGGFEPNAQWYGEPGWAEVRMRVAGHLSTAGRDRARLAAQAGDLERAAELYDTLHGQLSAIPTAEGISEDILELLVEAAARDARRMRGEAFTLAPVEHIDLAAYADFDDRHELRVTLWSSYLASVDPVQFSEPWGYWPTDLEAGALFSWQGLGMLPTGDSLIDVAGEPGPTAIGKLAVMDLSDPTHQAWLKAAESRLNEADDDQVLAIVRELVTELDRSRNGSRYYNIKSLRNGGVRVLARRGRYDDALALLSDNRPLHDHDWACPNRDGILLAIEGRLQARAGKPQADATLEKAVAASLSFLDDVTRAEQTPSAPRNPGKGPPGAPPPNPPPPPRR